MKKQLLSAVVVCALGAVGCGEEPVVPTPVDPGPNYNTESKVRTFLEGKTLVMTGANIPSHPNGLDEDVDYGPSSQCYNKVTIGVGGGNFNVSSVRARIENPTGTPPKGDCNHANVLDTVNFASTGYAVPFVKDDGSCFDVTVTYTGFSQEGRAQISQDGKTVKMELYFQGVLGHRCADGAVGDKTVKRGGTAFTGNAVQVYAVQ